MKTYCLTQCHFDDKLQSIAQIILPGINISEAEPEIMYVDLEFHHLPLAQQLILPFFIYSLMKGQESLALLLHSFHLYINQIPCSLQFLCVIPLQMLYCIMVWLMRFVLNQRVPSSGYNTLNSFTLNEYFRYTSFNIDKQCYSMKENTNKGNEVENSLY